MRRSLWILPFAIALSLIAVVAVTRDAIGREVQPVYLGRMLIGWDLEDLPENPSIAEQIDAGHKELAVEQSIDEGLDSNREVFEYFNEIATKLVTASDQSRSFR
jgi:hypothetical protein